MLNLHIFKVFFASERFYRIAQSLRHLPQSLRHVPQSLRRFAQQLRIVP